MVYIERPVNERSFIITEDGTQYATKFRMRCVKFSHGDTVPQLRYTSIRYKHSNITVALLL